jgi:hypothetical protein
VHGRRRRARCSGERAEQQLGSVARSVFKAGEGGQGGVDVVSRLIGGDGGRPATGWWPQRDVLNLGSWRSDVRAAQRVIGGGMTELIEKVIWMPWRLFVSSVETMLKTAQAFQGPADRGSDVMADGAIPHLDAQPQVRAASAIETEVSHGREPCTAKQEKNEMSDRDRDLSGDDLKLVHYRILFTKRDLEAVFEEQHDLVTYNANAAEWAGLKVAEFMEQVARGAVARPAKWRASGYPQGASDRGWGLPEEDRRHLRIYFEVLQRFGRERAEYDQEQVKVLREINSNIGRIGRSIS